MFRKITEWVKNLFTSKKHNVQTTAAANNEPTQTSTPKQVTTLSADDWNRIERALEQELPLPGQVLASKKGGYTVSILGTYAFMPKTLAHYLKGHTPDKMLGKQIMVYIRSVKDSHIVVSHIEFVKEAYSKLAIGDTYDAVVAKICDGHLLVYIPKNELYVNVSQVELSWSYDVTVGDYTTGQEVKVRIIKKDSIEKIQASIRQAGDGNPYEKRINDYKVGDVLSGKVINVVEFGAFVKISEGVVGLLHRSEVRWGEPVTDMRELFKYGDMMRVMVSRIDHEQGRIFLSLKRLNMEQIADTFKVGKMVSAYIADTTDESVTLEMPYGLTAQIKQLRFAKKGIVPIEGETISVKVLSYSAVSNNVRIAL